MRFREFKLILKESATPIVVVGDSIAVGIGPQVKGATVDAKERARAAAILSKITANTNVQGAQLAIVSVGSNDIVKGQGDPQKLQANVTAIRAALKAQSYAWILPYDQKAAAAVQAAVGGDKTVPLRGIPSGDGVHPTSYASVAQMAIQGATITTSNSSSSSSSSSTSSTTREQQQPDANTAAGPFSISEISSYKGPEVADVQKFLMAIGYDLGPKGADGIKGRYTTAAIRKFQTDNGLKVDGAVGPETAGKMNELLEKNPEGAKKLTKSTEADVNAHTSATPGAPATKHKTSAAGPSGKSKNNMVDKQAIKAYLLTKMDENHALGILANIQAESSFNSGVMGDGGNSGGLFQHHDNPALGEYRFTNMVKYAGDNWQSNWQGQVDFALSEQYGKAYLAKKFATPEEASKWFTMEFERPDKKLAKAEERIKYISQFA